MAKAKTSLIDEVAAYIKPAKPPAKWHHKVAPEHAATMAEIKAAWKSGRLGKSKKGAAMGIAKYLTANGIASIGHNGVISWLDEA